MKTMDMIRPALLAGLALAASMASPTAATAQLPCGAQVTFETGDTFMEIAERCGVTVAALLAENPGVVDESDLEVGNRLRVPAPTAAQPSPLQACGASYTVRPGDTVAEIALKCGLTMPLLLAANGPLPDPLGVHAGIVLRIPDLPSRVVADPATLAVPIGGAGEVVRTGEAAADSAAIPAEELLRIEGVLEAGPRCMLVRGPDGEQVAIAGEIRGDFTAGQRVVLMGVRATGHDCGTSPTVELRILYRPGT